MIKPAKQMREEADLLNKTKEENQSKTDVKNILERIEGRKQIYFLKVNEMLGQTKDTLEDNGYKVTYEAEYNDSYYLIKW